MNTHQKDGAPDMTDRAASLVLLIGLANLSSYSQGTSPFLWVLPVPDAGLAEQMPAESGPQFRRLKKIGMLMTGMIKWRQRLRLRSGFR